MSCRLFQSAREMLVRTGDELVALVEAGPTEEEVSAARVQVRRAMLTATSAALRA